MIEVSWPILLGFTVLVLGGLTIMSLRIRRLRERFDLYVAAHEDRLDSIDARLSRVEQASNDREPHGKGFDRPASEPLKARANAGATEGSNPGRSALMNQPALIAVPGLATPESHVDQDPTATSATSRLRERHAEIQTLAESGISVEEIARRTGLPIGQVDLVLSLDRQAHSSRNHASHD
jgi:hypothetical protein